MEQPSSLVNLPPTGESLSPRLKSPVADTSNKARIPELCYLSIVVFKRPREDLSEKLSR